LQVPVGVAERGDGAAADPVLNGDRLAVLVVDDVDRRQLDQDRHARAHLELQLAGASLMVETSTFIGPLA